MPNHSKIWFITGVSSGLGLAIAQKVVGEGGSVVGSVRRQEQGEAFVQALGANASYVRMDVNVPEDREAAMEQIMRQYGRVDVLVNNAGYGLFGAIEEISSAEARAQMETNFFAALALTQAVLPVMRAQGSGHIIQISSVAGFTSSAGLGLYNASKYALEGFSEALALEVAPLGIKVTIVEPGPFRTRWAGDSSVRSAQQLDVYAGTAHATYENIAGYSGKQPGDPDKAADVIFDAVCSARPPLRLPLGHMAIERMRRKLAHVAQEIDACEEKSLATVFDA